MATALARMAVVSQGRDAKAVMDEIAARELIFAVVGPVGSGTSEVAKILKNHVETALGDSTVALIKASQVIAKKLELNIDESIDPLKRARQLQDGGDSLRENDRTAVAKLLVAEIRSARAAWESARMPANEQSPGAAAIPLFPQPTSENGHRVYILDSLKHPAEVELLRSVYKEAFCLVGVVCDAKVRGERLRTKKCTSSSSDEIQTLMARDEDAQTNWGQKVTDTFHLSDFFVDNTPERFTPDETENKAWVINDKIGRLMDILTGNKIVRPLANEAGMFHAGAAQARSSCLSRQVGAALTDSSGNLIATGTNEVPMAGGGVYGGGFAQPDEVPTADHRCHVTKKHCSNSKVQDEIMTEVIDAIPSLKDSGDKDTIKKILKSTALGRLLEFSRAVHAEMDALLSAARTGASTVGTKLYCTTFPCHYCARHLVTAGVDEVQYIEPYAKSRAFDLHGDAIQQNITSEAPPGSPKRSKVLFRPFTGVAPRFYKRAFLKNRKLKDAAGNLKIQAPEWEQGLLKIGYKEIEEKLLQPIDKE